MLIEGEIARTKIISNRNNIIAARHPVCGERNIIIPADVVQQSGLCCKDLRAKMEVELSFVAKGCGYEATELTAVPELRPRKATELPKLRPGCECRGQVVDMEPGRNYVFLDPIGFQDDWVFCHANDMAQRLWTALQLGYILSLIAREDPSGRHLRAARVRPCPSC